MIIEVKVPSPGESVSQVTVANWLVTEGSFVTKDSELAELESDKATLPLIAPESGQIKIMVDAGNNIAVGAVACTIDTSVTNSVVAETKPGNVVKEVEISNIIEVSKNSVSEIKTTPLAQKIMEENNLNIDDIISGLRKITAKDVEIVLANKPKQSAQKETISRSEERIAMSSLRKKLSERLVSVKNQTAMLTTFNEVDLSEIIGIRNKYKDEFYKKHGVKIGFMSFFAKAAAISLKLFPNVNSRIENEEFVYPNFVDLGIAVQTDKGLMVPVLRNADTSPIFELELSIYNLAEKARKHKISLEEMAGGTFTITNGGVFGSLLSTPILNPPQSAILGMHNIVERPIAVNGKVEIRPMMYIAMSYDHRVLDGKDSVLFLKKIKELLENPVLLINDGYNAIYHQLGL
ncbi:MAG: 2-oxoglutarate dehydrogenase complex dihydrolipoyllysine-residue succinyltransferase [Bacteroidia bacterium]|nr:2-oxoglutarate dehydrogenase complex dihydrolipoyllysine-residue succinyltransferase [Bacteroidia bacterium]